MNKYVVFAMLLVLSIALYSATEYYIRLENVKPYQMNKLTNLVSVDKIEDNTVFAYANQQELDFLKTQPFAFEVIPGPLAGFEPEMADSREQMRNWDYYPTYDTYVDIMYQFAEDHPDICEVFSIGNSIEGREILMAHIGDDLNIESDEPEFFYMGQIHGDELVASILLLHLIDDLLTQYGSDPRIENIVNEIDIYINPLDNPDGLYAGGNDTVAGATRGNANGIDMNRNFPDPEDGMNPDGNATQPENVLQMDFAAEHSFVFSANLHSGTEVVNYPWDTWSTLHADDDWWQLVSHTYADAAQELSPANYFNEFNDGITNGFQWYTISGGYQDYINWYDYSRSVTLELSDVKALPEDQLEDYYLWNYNSMLLFMEEVLYGLRGIVTDPSGQPLSATVSIDGHDFNHSEVFTDPDVGNYHRPIYEGTYDFTFSAWGYESQTHTISIPEHDVVIQDVTLQPAALAQLDGVVSDSESGLPLFGVNLSLTDTPLQNEMTGNDGQYSFCDIPAGEYEIFVFANGYSSSIESITIEAGVNTLDLELQANNAISFETGYFPAGYDISFDGSADWFVSDETAYDGIFSSRSGVITHNRQSSILLTVDLLEEGSISFRRKVSSEEYYDFLRFYIDDIEQDQWSGSSDWEREIYNLTAGTYTFKWEFDKDGSVSGGSDCGWIDFIEIGGIPEPEVVLGDIDTNGFTEAYDASLVQRYVVEMDPGNAAPIPWQEWRYLSADVDGNLLIEAYDASLILQYFLEIIESFPVE